MAPTLTAGAISAVEAGDLELRPVVQVVEVKPIQSTQERYRVVFSDGAATGQVMLATQLNGLVKDGKLRRGSVVQLLEYIASTIQSRRFVDDEILFSFEQQ